MTQQRSPKMFPWAPSASNSAASQTPAPSPNAPTANPISPMIPKASPQGRSPSLPNFGGSPGRSPEASPGTSQGHPSSPEPSPHIPRYSPPVPAPDPSQPTLDAAQAQRLSQKLRQHHSQQHPQQQPQQHPPTQLPTQPHRQTPSPPTGAAHTLPTPPQPARSKSSRRSPQPYSLVSPSVGSKTGRRRPIPPWLQALHRLDTFFQGKPLLWLFVAWAILWLLGTFAVVRLLDIGSSPPPRPPLNSPTHPDHLNNPAAENFPNTAPIIEGGQTVKGSGPPILPTAIALLICLGGGWLRLQQFRSRS